MCRISCFVASFACSGPKSSPGLREEEEVDLSLPVIRDINARTADDELELCRRELCRSG
jgi:hypothetical protein